MSEALLEMMAPILKPYMQQREEKAVIRELVNGLHDFRHKDSEIKTFIMQKYNLSAEEADSYLSSSGS